MKRDVFAIDLGPIPHGWVYWIMRDDGMEICSCVLDQDSDLARQQLSIDMKVRSVLPDRDTLGLIETACPDGYSITWVTLENRKENERWQATEHMRAEVTDGQS